MAKTKAQTVRVPKQIRHEVKTILQHAAKKDGITQAVILFVDNKGVLRGEGSASHVLRQVMQQAVDNFNLIRSAAHDAFNDGWLRAEQVQQQTQAK